MTGLGTVLLDQAGRRYLEEIGITDTLRVVEEGRTYDVSDEVARQIGCDGTINIAHEDAGEAMRALTGGRGADVVYEAVGGVANTLAQSIEVAARGGRVGVLGAFVDPQTIATWLCMRQELSLHWVWSYGLWDGVPEYQVPVLPAAM